MSVSDGRISESVSQDREESPWHRNIIGIAGLPAGYEAEIRASLQSEIGDERANAIVVCMATYLDCDRSYMAFLTTEEHAVIRDRLRRSSGSKRQ